MEPEGSLPCSQVLVLCQMHPVHNFQPSFPKIHYNIIFLSVPCFLWVIFSLQDFWPKFYMHFSSLPSMLQASVFHLICLDMKCTSYEDPHYEVFCSLMLVTPYVHILSWAPCSETPSICFLYLLWETKFHIHTKQVKFKFLKRRQEDKIDSELNGNRYSLNIICS
jgi:hypothetical protein